MTESRLHALDALRGLMLVVMTVDHLDLFGPIYRFTYEPLGYASAAEGFVLLSGIVAGIVYTRYAEHGRLAARLKRRLVTLWASHAAIVAGMLAFWWARPELRPHGSLASAALAAVGGLILLNQEPPLDILPLYLVLLAILPLVIVALRAGRASLALAVSAGVWLVAQVPMWTSWSYPAVTWEMAGVATTWHPNNFHLAAWQFLFVAGVWAGWRWRRGEGATLERIPEAAWPLLVGTLLVLFALRHGFGLPEIALARPEVGRANLGPLRLLNIALLVWAVAWIGRVRPDRLRCAWLERLGRHALVVFVWHVGLQLALRPIYADAAARWGVPARIVLLVLAVLSLNLPAIWREHTTQHHFERSNLP
jgi:hypothetical protein